MFEGYDSVRQHGLGDVLREHRRSRPKMIAAVDGDMRLTFVELDSRVNRLVHALRAQGIGSGERILWIGQNSFRVLEILLAAAKLGAIFCPANWRMSAEETIRVIDDLDPQVVFWQELEVGEEARKAVGLHRGTRPWIQHDGVGEGSYEHFVAGHPDHDDDMRVDLATPVLALYTAAFDGYPKAALLSHQAILCQGLTSGYGFAIDETSVYLNSGPLFHLGTLNTTLAVFLFGGCNVFVRRVDAAEMLEVIQRERVSHAFIPKPTHEQIRELNAGGSYDLSSLWPTAGADIGEWRHPQVMPVHAPFTKRLGIYGQTETTGWMVMGWLGGEGSRPSPMAQVRIVDDEGNELAPGEVGEIVVRGPLVMTGYYGADEENARRTRDGWHHTCDLGKRLDDGSIVFIGPKTVLIKSALENIYPAEVEVCLKEHPAVGEVCVIGVPDPVWTQCVKAVVILRPGMTASEAELISHCRERIASYKKPKVVEFVTTLPRLGNGFIDREAVDRNFGGGGYPFSKAV